MSTVLKVFSKEELIEKFKEIYAKGWIKNNRGNNDGAVGNTLEDLLEIPENNLPIPNAAEWELKAQRSDTSSLPACRKGDGTGKNAFSRNWVQTE